MGKFDIFNKFNSAVIVLNEKKEVVFQNNLFKRVFSDYENIEKFSHKLDYNVYALDFDNVSELSPILQAFNSKEDFSAHVAYRAVDNMYYFDMNSSKKSKYTIIVFTDVTAKMKLEEALKANKNLGGKVDNLLSENKSLLKIQQKAQSQAMKLLLLNNISNIIRESVDTSKILQSALYEISQLFAAFKAYFASYSQEMNTYVINESLGNKEIGTRISFDKETEKKIGKRKVFLTSCMREYAEAKPFKELVQRIIMPIFHMNKRLGVIVILTKQKTRLDDALGFLEGVATQLGNAIIQAELQLQLINSEKMASIGQLIAGVAHEINTPLASIKSNNDLSARIIAKISDNNIDILKEMNSIDKEAIERINRIVVSLRKFVRLDEAELQEADINKEINLTLDLIRHETKNRIEIIKNYGELPPIKCYPNMLNQVFMNILVNAAHAITGEGKIAIDTEYKNKNLIVKIKDTGCGIKEPEKIFTAGYTTKGVGVGTGLGLAISQKIIEKHSGKITVNTVLGRGSEFVITIPSG